MAFDNINYTPPRLRKLRGVPLSMAQINEIVDAANAAATTPDGFPAALAAAREAFMASNEAVGGSWRRRGSGG